MRRLAALPEIERENILAGRLEEMQKFKDSHNLDQMFRTIGGGASDDDDEDDEPRKRRKLPCQCSVVLKLTK
jgi:RNA polymerase-associated protein RTF1